MKYLLGIPYSFYSKRWYQQVYTASSKQCFLYLLIMLALVWFLFSIRFGLNVENVLNKTIQGFASQMPNMTLKNKTLTTDQPGTYKIFYPGTKHLLAIIQTDKPLNDFDKLPVEVWVGHEQILFKTSEAIHVSDYAHLPDAKINSNNFSQFSAPYLKDLLRIIVIIFYFIGLIVIFPCSIILAWIIAPFIKSIAASLQREFKFVTARNLAIAGMTPFWVLFSIFYLFKLLSVGLLLALLLILVLYPVYATIICKNMAGRIKT